MVTIVNQWTFVIYEPNKIPKKGGDGVRKRRKLIDDIFDRIEAKWKHIAYDPNKNKIYLLTDPYRCLDTKDDWFDFQDGRVENKILNNNRRIRRSKTKDWVYLCEK